MLSRSLRPLTWQAASLAISPARSNIFQAPLCARTYADSADSTNSTDSTDSAAAVAPRKLPYFVSRNNLNNLPIYQKSKAGGNFKITILKRGEGDLAALKQDLKDVLHLPDDEISINSRTQHIIVKGHKREVVKHFLHTLGF
ncbi:mitochondrial large subunit ribosomal protein-domain-containing protein [Nemania serpens]|nr:mitochondrial large subunit ribosomal protein-domain-containing protein [Nemania serpens]